MKSFLIALLTSFVFAPQLITAQQPVDALKFFSDSSILNASISLNVEKIFSHRSKEGYKLPATFTYNADSNTKITDTVGIEIRGHFRRDYCYLPPLRIVFNYTNTASLFHLKALKLVSDCKFSADYDQYLLKEFLIYKIYNLLTDKSFRVRLVNINFVDSGGKKRSWAGHSFFLEDIKDVAKRNNCTEFKKEKLPTEATNRSQMTLVSIFQYMIGNTDWAVSVGHNTKLIMPVYDSVSPPFVVPYDFDYCGLVNTEYAIPDERLGIENVRQRLYRGFPRQASEVNDVLDVFKAKKDSIYNLINNFNLLTSRSKKDMIYYLNDFYKMINDPAQVKDTFIRGAVQ